MTKEYKIAVIPGDGIGPEIIDSAMKVLKKTAQKYGFGISFDIYLAGGCAVDKYGVPLPDDTLEACKASDAVLLGAVGGPQWDGLDPSIRPEKALLGLRKGLGLYSNLRPAILFSELASASPLKDPGDIDLIIVRELTGGIYFGESGRSYSEELLSDNSIKGECVYDTESYSEGEIRRILDQGFRIASGRSGKLTLVDKANVLSTSRLWRKIAEEMRVGYPEVSLDFLYVDNACMQLIGRPSSFDVIVTSNMFGDILSDEAGMLTGSVGLLPSASLGAPGTPGMYEPVHGSAPDIAGSGKADPIAAILSASMLLDMSLGEADAAEAIEAAVRMTIAKGYRTADIYSAAEGELLVGCDEMTSAILENIK